MCVCVCVRACVCQRVSDTLPAALGECLTLSDTRTHAHTHTHTHTHPFNGPFSRTTRVGRYQKGKTNLDFTEARDSEWQWHQLSHMQVCTSLQTDNHANTSPLSFLQAGCPCCRPTDSVKALKALNYTASRCKVPTANWSIFSPNKCTYKPS